MSCAVQFPNRGLPPDIRRSADIRRQIRPLQRIRENGRTLQQLHGLQHGVHKAMGYEVYTRSVPPRPKCFCNPHVLPREFTTRRVFTTLGFSGFHASPKADQRRTRLDQILHVRGIWRPFRRRPICRTNGSTALSRSYIRLRLARQGIHGQARAWSRIFRFRTFNEAVAARAYGVGLRYLRISGLCGRLCL